ncbi:MAG: hypothetical protein HOG03_17655 [Desulfobacula sp.]|jgi:hypothetical protein|uniref:hypothetical protein n=1 Tax=Desulfobacula sp. TaxID=2593537 RepID=UPI001D91E8CF|nr:hypothetical protein [Desulfobacula sp.]MBT3806405.1 hypothetical protein [Desulfobacula sp.]MBT4201162.1 hypothetical protein [Desulfobacula sp.]MBT4873840.1 hypothetical protein [Desulfobacula sp.]MBT5545965.1 hypothetical protein [Desulfobacula sp.]
MDVKKGFFWGLQNQLRINGLIIIDIEELILHSQLLEDPKEKLKPFSKVTKERESQFLLRIKNSETGRYNNSNLNNASIHELKNSLSDCLDFISQLQANEGHNIGAKDLYQKRKIEIETNFNHGNILIAAGNYHGNFYEQKILKLYGKVIRIINFCYSIFAKLIDSPEANNFQIKESPFFYLSQLTNNIQRDTMAAKGFMYEKIEKSRINTQSVKGSTENRALKIQNLATFIKRNSSSIESGYIISKKTLELYFVKRELPTSYSAKKKYLEKAEEILGIPIVIKK